MNTGGKEKKKKDYDSDLLSSHGKRSVEPLLECAAALKDGWQQEVEQCPQLGQLVLQWRPRQQDTPWSQVVCVQDLSQLTVVVLHPVALIHDHILPANLEPQLQCSRET